MFHKAISLTIIVLLISFPQYSCAAAATVWVNSGYSDGCHSSDSSGSGMKRVREGVPTEEDPTLPGMVAGGSKSKWHKHTTDSQESDSDDSLEGQVQTTHRDLSDLSPEKELEEIVVEGDSHHHRRQNRQKSRRSKSMVDFERVAVLKDAKPKRKTGRSLSEDHVKRHHSVEAMSIIRERASSSGQAELKSFRASSPSLEGESTQDLFYRSTISAARDKWTALSTARRSSPLTKKEVNFRRGLRYYINLSKILWRDFVKEHGSESLRFDHFHDASWQGEYAATVVSFHMMGQFFVNNAWALKIHLDALPEEQKRGISDITGLLSHWQKTSKEVDRTILTETQALRESEDSITLVKTWNERRYNILYRLFSSFSQRASQAGVNVLCSEEVGLSISFPYIRSNEDIRMQLALASVADTGLGTRTDEPAVVPRVDVVVREIEETADPKTQEYSWLYRHLCCCCITED